MPRIPAYDRQVAAPGPVSGRRADASDFGVDAAAAVANFANSLSKAGIQINETRTDVLVGRQVAQATSELQALQNHLENGSMDDDGNITPAPPPEMHTQLYSERLKDIESRALEGLGGDEGLLKVFKRRLMPVSLGTGLTVQKNAIARQRTLINSDLDVTLSILSDQAASAQDPAMVDAIRTQAELAIERAVTAGVYTPDEANTRRDKFNSNIAVAGYRNLISDSPESAFFTILQQGKPVGMDESAYQKWVDTATRAANQALTRERSDADRMRRETERAQNKLEEKTAKELFARPIDELTSQLVLDNKENLSDSDFRMLLKRANGETVVVNRAVYSELRIAAAEGQDVTHLAQRAYEQLDIGRGELDAILNEIEEGKKTDKLPADRTPYGAGKAFLSTSLKVSDTNPSAGASLRLAEALDEWRGWADANPNATMAEARKEYQGVAKQYQFLNLEDSLLAIPTSRYLIGNRRNPNLSETWERVKELHRMNQISADELGREADIINNHRRILGEMRRAAEVKADEAQGIERSQ